MASLQCPRCGAPVDPNSTYCGNCGYNPRVDGASTSRPLQDPSSGGYPPAYQNNVSPSDSTTVASTYRKSVTPPPPPDAPGNIRSAGTSPAYPFNTSPTYPANVPPPPPGGNMSSPNYPPSGVNFSTNDFSNTTVGNGAGNGASNTPGTPSPTPPPQRKRRGNGGLIALVILVLVVLLAGGGLYLFRGAFLPKTSTTGGTNAAINSTNVTATAYAQATANAPTATATTSTNATPTDTSTPQSSTTPTAVATSPTGGTNSYTAIQPGPGCDTNGGTWTPDAANITGISCGTTLTVKGGTRGYMYLQLPGNKAFSSNNIIGVSSTVQGDGQCVGLAEQSTNSGYLAEYCGNGNWYIDTISSGGAIIQTLAKNITSTRSSEQLTLTLKGTSLIFSIDTESHTVTIPAGPVTKVAISVSTPYYDTQIQVTNFSYTAQ